MILLSFDTIQSIYLFTRKEDRQVPILHFPIVCLTLIGIIVARGCYSTWKPGASCVGYRGMG